MNQSPFLPRGLGLVFALAAVVTLHAAEPRVIADLKLKLIPIPAGTFTMGSPPMDEKGTGAVGPLTVVTLTKPFWLGKTEVTQAQWQALGMRLQGLPRTEPASRVKPVANVSWDDAMEFCRKLTERERAAGRLGNDWEYTLPTEAQWEYACRAGTAGDYAGELDAMAWYEKNTEWETHAVATKGANAWGLHDMHGNVREWCRDWYGSYPGGNTIDPAGAASGRNRVNRGGGWADAADDCRSAFRNRSSPGSSNRDLGFRLALSSVP
ncbi:MAG: hypothetical protein RL077_2225 [Verrucomicrobiota bacterium]|jgi:formylglycine-generating enzyme required for sulfatase activity